MSDFNCASPAEALPDFVNDSLVFEPDSRDGYSTLGYVLLSAVLDAVAGQPFDQCAQQRVFTPAGMTATAIEGRPMEGDAVATDVTSVRG